MIEAAVEIPNRALFKAAEVCEIAQVQPYVLRSWEAEFPDLGVSRGGNARLYRRADVERVLRIKHLLFVEGLTLAGIRRRMGEESAPVAEDLPISELLGRNARERLAAVRRGLQSILELLAGNGSAGAARAVDLTPAQAALPSPAGPNGQRRAVAGSKPARGHGTGPKARRAGRRNRH